MEYEDIFTIFLAILLVSLISFVVIEEGKAARGLPQEYSIQKIDIREGHGGFLHHFDYYVIQYDDNGTSKWISTEFDDKSSLINIKKSNDETYRLLKIKQWINYAEWDLYIPKSEEIRGVSR